MKEVMKILAERISRKAILILSAMILVYMICVTPTVIHALIAMGCICGLCVLGVFLQFYIDCKKAKQKSNTE